LAILTEDVTARQQIDDFSKKQAADAGFDDLRGTGQSRGTERAVRIGQIRSKAKDADSVEFAAGGDRGQIFPAGTCSWWFLNALERDPLFFIVDSVQLGGAAGRAWSSCRSSWKPIRRRVSDAVGSGKPEQDDCRHQPDGGGIGVAAVRFFPIPRSGKSPAPAVTPSPGMRRRWVGKVRTVSKCP